MTFSTGQFPTSANAEAAASWRTTSTKEIPKLISGGINIRSSLCCVFSASRMFSSVSIPTSFPDASTIGHPPTLLSEETARSSARYGRRYLQERPGRRLRDMVRGAAAHFFLKEEEYERYYPLVLGVFQNNEFLVADSDRVEDRSILKGIPRSGSGHGLEVEIRRRPKGVDVHVLVVPLDELPEEPGRYLSREGVCATLQPHTGTASK